VGDVRPETLQKAMHQRHNIILRLLRFLLVTFKIYHLISYNNKFQLRCPRFHLKKMKIFYMLPTELWGVVGDFLYVTIQPHEDSLSMSLKPTKCFCIVYPGDENGEGFIQPCVLS
jgi:hypothetical protein